MRRLRSSTFPLLSGALALAVAALICPSQASAYRTLRDTGISSPSEIVWEAPLRYRISTQGLDPVWAADIQVAIERSFGSWSAADCSAFAATFSGFTDRPATAGDGISTIQFVTHGWVERGLTAESTGATTDVQLEQDSEGRWWIVEADIYFDAEHFEWTVHRASAGEGDGALDVTYPLHEPVGRW